MSAKIKELRKDYFGYCSTTKDNPRMSYGEFLEQKVLEQSKENEMLERNCSRAQDLLEQKEFPNLRPVGEKFSKEVIKNKVANSNNFDSFEIAIRYTFNRELLFSEKEFIDKIIDESMEEYAKQFQSNEPMEQKMSAIEFLKSKGITMLTCYTNGSRSYYIDSLSELMEEYAKQ